MARGVDVASDRNAEPLQFLVERPGSGLCGERVDEGDPVVLDDHAHVGSWAAGAVGAEPGPDPRSDGLEPSRIGGDRSDIGGRRHRPEFGHGPSLPAAAVNSQRGRGR